MKLLVLLSALAALALATPAADADAAAEYSSPPPKYKPCGGRSGIQCPKGQV